MHNIITNPHYIINSTYHIKKCMHLIKSRRIIRQLWRSILNANTVFMAADIKPFNLLHNLGVGSPSFCMLLQCDPPVGESSLAGRIDGLMDDVVFCPFKSVSVISG